MNAYETLGVSSNASDDEIKKAYRRLAMQFHPDRNNTSQAESRFKAVSEAYSILSDRGKRSDHDAYLHMQNTNRRYGERGDPIFDHFFRNGGFGGFEDIFGMGGLGARAYQRRTASINVAISLEEAFRGVKRTFTVDGDTMDVYIPPGVHSGEVLQARVDNTLDVHIRIRIPQHSIFDRRQNDLYTRIDVPMKTVLAGGEIPVPSIGGEIKLKIPKRISSHSKLRVRGAGMIKDGIKGDAYYEVRIVMPKLSAVQENLIAGILAKSD